MKTKEQIREEFEIALAADMLNGKVDAAFIASHRDGDEYTSESKYRAGVFTAAWWAWHTVASRNNE
jgi:hypothetical protein